MQGFFAYLFLTEQVTAFKPMQREDDIICKNNIPSLKGNTLQGESHERWGMKKDPKVFSLEKH